LSGSALSQAKNCSKVVTFFTLSQGSVNPGSPAQSDRWLEKNGPKYKDICFSDSAHEGLRNYAVVFSWDRAVSYGSEPVVRTSRSTDTTPVSGSGEITSYSGATWNYSFNGTLTTTTTTTSTEDVPYTTREHTAYITVYNEYGRIVSQRWKVYSAREGGNATNTLAYNLTSLLFSIGAKSRLLKAAIGDVEKQR
jgi:hypothetical protein